MRIWFWPETTFLGHELFNAAITQILRLCERLFQSWELKLKKTSWRSQNFCILFSSFKAESNRKRFSAQFFSWRDQSFVYIRLCDIVGILGNRIGGIICKKDRIALGRFSNKFLTEGIEMIFVQHIPQPLLIACIVFSLHFQTSTVSKNIKYNLFIFPRGKLANKNSTQ